MKTGIFITIITFFLSATGYAQTHNATYSNEHWADSILQSMTLDEKIGQLFMIAAYSNQSETHEADIEQQIKKYHIGGIIFFQGDPTRQVKLTNRYQKAAKYPLLIGLDAEHGAGWRLKSAMEFPKMGIIGAIRNDSLIFALGETIARHCHELGAHVNFAPVVDINSNPANPVIGIRSFGEDPEEVSQKAILFMKGSIAGGVLPVAKHFPGHGDTDTDSHKALPTISHSRKRLDSIELYPYRALIEAEVPAIMNSHLNVPALDSTGVPASLSPIIVDNLLKGTLGFRGICFTDAMNMKGVTDNTPPGEAEVKALLAGNDVLLFPQDIAKAVTAIKEAVKTQEICESMITEACRKILACKYTYALHNLHPSEEAGLWSRLNPATDIALKERLYKEAITLVKNNDSLLPLKRLDTLKIASINFGSDKVNHFQTMLQRYTQVSNFTAKRKLSEEEVASWQKKLAHYNCIIIYTQAGNNSAKGQFGYSESLKLLVEKLKGKRIIICQPAIPYGLKPYLSTNPDALLVSYDKHLYSQQYAAQAIFGGIGIRGQLPVSIDSVYRAGCGICTPKTRLSYESPESKGLSANSFKKIDSLCKRAVSIHATPGCQVLVAYKGSVIYDKAFGYHTYAKKKANTTTDIYDIASVTKITATLPAVMKLYDEKIIDLDAPLSRYYNQLTTTDKKDITVREVLCHHAGLKPSLSLFLNAIDKKSLSGRLFTVKKTPTNTLRLKDRLYVNPNFHFKDSTLSNKPKEGFQFVSPGVYIFPTYKDSIEYAILNSPLATSPKYAYSDLGFILLQHAVEETTGESISRYCKERFFSRLGMNNTDYKASERLTKSRIIPSCNDRLYRKTELSGSVHDPTAALMGGVAGHAGLFSTAEDLAKICQMYLNKGIYGGERYLTAATVETFTKRNDCFTNNRRGLGFDKPEPDTTKASPVCKQSSLNSYGHTGFTGIMAWCDPDNDLIYIFMSNRTYPNEFDNKLVKESFRTKIQEAIYKGLGINCREQIN